MIELIVMEGQKSDESRPVCSIKLRFNILYVRFPSNRCQSIMGVDDHVSRHVGQESPRFLVVLLEKTSSPLPPRASGKLVRSQGSFMTSSLVPFIARTIQLRTKTDSRHSAIVTRPSRASRVRRSASIDTYIRHRVNGNFIAADICCTASCTRG